MTQKPFAQRVALESRRRAMARAGPGWGLLGPELRHALVAYHALMMLGAQESEKYKPAVEVADAVVALMTEGD